MRPVQLLALLLAAGCARAPAQGNQAAPAPTNQAAAAQALQPDPVTSPEVTQEAVMDLIERQVRLPRGARPLASYARFYAWQRRTDGVRKVVATYTGQSIADVTGAGPGRHWVAENALPVVMDGGCGIISLSYDVATQRIEHVDCNGDA
jgi:hypothetical protein